MSCPCRQRARVLVIRDDSPRRRAALLRSCAAPRPRRRACRPGLGHILDTAGGSLTAARGRLEAAPCRPSRAPALGQSSSTARLDLAGDLGSTRLPREHLRYNPQPAPASTSRRGASCLYGLVEAPATRNLRPSSRWPTRCARTGAETCRVHAAEVPQQGGDHRGRLVCPRVST